MTDRITVLAGEIDQIKAAIARNDATAANEIKATIEQRYPGDKPAVLRYLVSVGYRREWER